MLLELPKSHNSEVFLIEIKYYIKFSHSKGAQLFLELKTHFNTPCKLWIFVVLNFISPLLYAYFNFSHFSGDKTVSHFCDKISVSVFHEAICVDKSCFFPYKSRSIDELKHTYLWKFNLCITICDQRGVSLQSRAFFLLSYTSFQRKTISR